MPDAVFNPKKIRVLIADDHELMRKSIIKILKRKNYDDTLECANGAEAIKILRSKPIDLIFCDIYMPKSDGFEVISAIRNGTVNHDIPIIVVTGEAGKDDIVKAVEMGAEEYLLKPFKSEELEKKTHKVLTKYHSPNPLLYQTRLAERQLLQGFPDEAQISIAQALKIDPKSARANHTHARIQLALEETENAIKILKRNSELHPSFLKNYLTLSDIYLSLNNHQEAVRNMKRELELNPKNSRRQVHLAKLLHKAGDYGGAIEHYRQALLENGKMRAALFGMGMAHAEADNLDKAVYYFKRMRRHNPDETKPLEAIVKYAIAAENPRIAEIALRDERKNNPKRIDTYVVLARFYTVTDRLEDALEAITTCVKLQPLYKDGLIMKATLELRLRKLEAAEQTVRSLNKEFPSAESSVKLAEVLTEQGRYTDSIRELHKTLKTNKRLGPTILMIAVNSAKTKQFTKAYFCYMRAMALGLKQKPTIQATKKIKKIIIDRRGKTKNAS